MTSTHTWMVRAGRGCRVFEDFRSHSLVAIGWEGVGDLNQYSSRKAVIKAMTQAYPNWKPGQVAVIGLRNVLAHEYGVIDYRRLYTVLRNDVPKLVMELKRLLGSIYDA